ncbi:DUF4992 family lipoprotein [Mangrovibacterium diazotrophicum]|uniref:Uncharacterized protein DUF5123 n=1 Tax=Mangrovibacterium diazotrophicum TaxID=1261403 RepID=A0A419W4A2_9BACT|nr:DUF4992 family lipoprotein [Mangrovibacterium diazotrophicum]RKD90279.1 uncharacterized protein DUF5123 [Mangrovibacterium diazotrophicum]
MNDNSFRSPFFEKRKSLKLIFSHWSGSSRFATMKMGILYLVAVLLSLNSCVKGYDDDWTFTSGVTGVTLESPAAETIQFNPSADGETVDIEWPVVYGAGGYQFSLYIVDDAENPVVVGVEGEIIDGCTATRDLSEDTKYLVVLKTLGNEKYDNAEATSSTEANFSTLLEATVIPGGTDLTEYFSENPIVDAGEELGYELEAGGMYTVSGEIDLGTAFLTLRGDKIDRPTVTMNAGFKAEGGGTKFKFINFECANLPTDGMFYGFNDIPDGAELVNNALMVTNPIVFQSCRFNELPAPLFWDNGLTYAVQTLLIKDCVVEMTDNGRFLRSSSTSGYLKDLKIENSTVYKNNTGTDLCMQFSTSQKAESFGWATASFSYSNCTFYGFDKLHNSNRYTYGWVFTTVENCLFLDQLRDQTARYILPGNRVYSSSSITFDNNTYWREGAVENYGSYDKSGTTLDEDPMCADPANGDFTVGNSNTIAAGIGDPRWLSAQ